MKVGLFSILHVQPGKANALSIVIYFRVEKMTLIIFKHKKQTVD